MVELITGLFMVRSPANSTLDLSLIVPNTNSVPPTYSNLVASSIVPFVFVSVYVISPPMIVGSETIFTTGVEFTELL